MYTYMLRKVFEFVAGHQCYNYSNINVKFLNYTVINL